MHPEPLQQKLLCDTLETLKRNNCQRLEDAWFAWSATTWVAGSDKSIVWDVSDPQRFGRSVLQCRALRGELLFRSVASHIPTCVSCRHLLALISDGKAGSARRVCRNLNKLHLVPYLPHWLRWTAIICIVTLQC